MKGSNACHECEAISGLCFSPLRGFRYFRRNRNIRSRRSAGTACEIGVTINEPSCIFGQSISGKNARHIILSKFQGNFMTTTSGRPMTVEEKTRLHQEIYHPNTGPERITTEAILEGCKEAEEILSEEFVEMVKHSPFYFRNRERN
jgi:hypothetical protein